MAPRPTGPGRGGGLRAALGRHGRTGPAPRLDAVAARTRSGAPSPWAESRPADVPPLGSNFELADASEVFVPFARWTRERLPDVPLWNPHIMGGRPFVGNAQSAVFSPVQRARATCCPSGTSLAVAAMLKLFLAAFGTYLLARLLGMRFGGALAAGHRLRLRHVLRRLARVAAHEHLRAHAVAARPGANWWCEDRGRCRSRGSRRSWRSSSSAVTPRRRFHAMFALVVFFAFRLAVAVRARGEPARPLLRPALVFAGALATGAAIAAVALVPFLELLFNSGDLDAARWTSRPATGRASTSARCSSTTTGAGRRRARTSSRSWPIRGWYAGAATLMLAAARAPAPADARPRRGGRLRACSAR